MMLDDIVNCIYEEDRFKKEGIEKQIYVGDTDSIVIHSSLIEKLKHKGFIGSENGKLTDDLNKTFLTTGYAKITKYCSAAPKKYAISYILPDGKVKEKIKCNGISQKNMRFYNPITKQEETKLTYDVFEHMYLDSLPSRFYMPDKLIDQL